MLFVCFFVFFVSLDADGGLALFGGMQLYDVQRTAKAARLTPPDAVYDPMRQSISQYLNTINIFIRMVQILGMSGNNRKR